MPDSPFALERFAPSDVTFTLAKHPDVTFKVDGDPDVDTIARMYRIEEALQEGADTEAELAAAALEGRDLILEMVLEKDPGFVGPLRMGLNDVLVVFSLILRGSTVAQAVAEAILAPSVVAASEPGATPFEHQAPGDGEGDGEPGGPLASEKRSSERSSSSEPLAAGALATGTA
jgi:hypothetical protein